MVILENSKNEKEATSAYLLFILLYTLSGSKWSSREHDFDFQM